jgi:hypothetical protein
LGRWGANDRFFMNTHATHVVDDASNNLRPVECSVSQASRNSTREYQNNKPSNSTRIAYPIAKVGQSGFIINLRCPCVCVRLILYSHGCCRRLLPCIHRANSIQIPGPSLNFFLMMMMTVYRRKNGRSHSPFHFHSFLLVFSNPFNGRRGLSLSRTRRRRRRPLITRLHMAVFLVCVSGEKDC